MHVFARGRLPATIHLQIEPVGNVIRPRHACRMIDFIFLFQSKTIFRNFFGILI